MLKNQHANSDVCANEAEAAVLALHYPRSASSAVKQAARLANLRAAHAVHVKGGKGSLSWVAAALLHPGARHLSIAVLYAKLSPGDFAKLSAAQRKQPALTQLPGGAAHVDAQKECAGEPGIVAKPPAATGLPHGAAQTSLKQPPSEAEPQVATVDSLRTARVAMVIQQPGQSAPFRRMRSGRH